MKMNFSLKRVLSFLLVAIMIIGMYPMITSAATDVTLTFKNGTTQDGEGRYLLYFEGLGDTADKYWNNNTVYIDGKEVSGDGVHYLHLGSDFALLLYYSAIEENVTAASGFSGVHTLQIKSGTSLANGEYTVANDVWLKLNGYEVTQYTPVNLTYASGGAQDFATRFALTFSGFADTADKYWNNNTVYIDGKAVSGEGVHYLPNSDDTIGLYLSYSVLEADVTTAASLGSHILDIPAGTLLGNYVVAKSLCFQINGSSITQVYTPDITVTLNDDWRNDSGCTGGFYFSVSPTDALPYDTANWTTRYSMTTGGIYVNDTLVSGAKLVKVTDILYYTAFDGCGITFAGGDVVKIAGTVTSDGYTVEYAEQAFQYDGNGAWDIYTAPVGNKFALDESDPGGWQEAASRYLIWLTDDISGDKTELGTVQLLIDGASQNVATALIDGRYALLLNADCGISALGEHTVQITAGQAMGEYTVLNDAVFYTHADGSINTTAPKYVTLGVNGGAWQANLSRYLIWLTDDIADTKAEVGSISVIVNGESTTASTALIDGQYALLLNASNGITGIGEHSIQFTVGQSFGDYLVKNDLTIYTHIDGSVNTTAPKYVTLGVNGGAWQGDQSRYLIWLTDDITDTKAEVGSISVTVNGESTTASTALIDGTYALLLTASNGITAMGEHSIQITAGQMFGGYIVSNDLTIYTHTNGIINTTAPVYVTLDLDAEDPGGWQGDNNRYLVWLTDDISGDKPIVSSITAEVNGESKTVAVALIDGRYALVLDESCGISALNENYVQITAGQYFGDYIVNNDLTIYTHKDGTIDAKEPTIDVPADRYVTLIAKDENGEIVMNRAVAWNADSIALTEQELKDSVADGNVLLGYVYADALYASLANINTEELTELEITLDTLNFAVHSELRHGSDLTDSGLRFVAALGDPSYSKVLLIADSEDKLNAENADCKVGDGITADFKQITAIDGTACYSIALTNIPAADYNKTYYAAGAILVTYADGTEGYVYTDAVASTVNEAAQNSHIASDSKKLYTDGVIHLDAKANLVGSYSYTAQVSNDANGDYVITYTGTQKVEALTVVGQRFTAADGVQFGDGTITIPATLFANALLQEELAETNKKLQIGAYRGPAIGLHTYTDSDGVVTDYSITRTHDEVYADLEDFFAAGFNIWMAEEWIYGASNYGENDALSALDLAAEYCINHGLTGEDIQVLITDSLLNGLLEGYTMPENAGFTVAEYAAIIAERFNVLKNYNPKVNGVEVGTEYNCFAGYILRDEPHYDHLDYYNGWFSFLGADSDQSISVIANSASTGGQVSGTVNALGMLSDGYTLYFSMISNGASKKYIVSGSTSEDPCTTEEFTAYLRKFVDGVNSTVWNYSNMMLTTDSYGLNTDVSGKFGSTTVTSTEMMNEYWQENLALVASLVEEKNPNAIFATVLRSFGMTRLYMMAKASTWYNSVSWSEYQKFDAAWGQQAMDLQAYTSLAHGYTYLSYFTYWETQHQSYTGETFTDACVMWDDNMNPVKQNMYYWVKNTNAEIRAMENLIGSFSYSGTAAVASGSSYYCGTDGLWSASQLADNTAIASVSVSEDTTVGHYTKDEGNFGEMFILVNMSHPEEVSSDTVTVTFDSGYTGAIVYIDGEATLYQLSDGVCTVTIPSGEGVVVIPVA